MRTSAPQRSANRRPGALHSRPWTARPRPVARRTARTSGRARALARLALGFLATLGTPALAQGATEGSAVHGAAPAPLTLLERAVPSVWEVDRALVLPLAGTDADGSAFRVLSEREGQAHDAVVAPSAPVGEGASSLGGNAGGLSAGGAMCRIRTGALAAGAGALASAIREAGAPEVTAPRPRATLGDHLEVRGRAAGTWYFEGNFPVRLVGPDGRELAVAPAVADGDWMTEAYVPFVAELQLPAELPTRAMLVLERANPSGLPRHAGFLLLRLGCG